jgi:four helix bundle protein
MRDFRQFDVWKKAKELVARFLDIAMGSVAETRSHLILATDLGYLKPEVLDCLIEKALEIGRMLNGLAETLRRSR